jgi:hypothetical protein
MERHIVITGQPRSGSTLLYNMLRHTLQGFGLFDAEVPAAGKLHLSGSHCSKRPKDIFDTPNIMKVNRGRKRIDLIVTIRDPRDVLTSRHNSVPDDYFIGADYCYFVPERGKPTLTDPGYLHIQKAILDVARGDLFPQGIFLMKYEQLVSDPEGIQRLLATQLNLRFEGRFSEFHKQKLPTKLTKPLNGVRAVEIGRRRRWAAPEHRARIIDQFTRFPVLHDVVEGMGYEQDRGWFEELVQEHMAASD